jgi:hypothetical protein
MEKHLFLSIFFLILSIQSAFSQSDSAQITFDRPGISDSPYIVDLQNWQVEFGASTTKNGDWNDLLYSSLMIRKSIHKRFELRLTMMHQPVSYLLDHFFETAAERYPVSLFGKWKIADESGILPDMALLGGFIVPIQKNFVVKNTGFELYLMCQNNISHSFSINYGGGILQNHPQAGLMHNYSLCFNFSLSSKVGIFAENYAYAQNWEKDWEEGFDGGIVYSPVPKTQIDLSAGYHFLADNHWYFVSVGFSRAFFGKK